MTLIKINRSSLRKNPNAGQSEYLVSGHSTIKATFLSINPELPPGVDGHITSYTHVAYMPEGTTIYRVEAYVLSPEDPVALTNLLGPSLTVNIDRHVRRVQTLTPEPEILFDYEDTQVVCKYCQAGFSYKLLQFDMGYSADENGDDFEVIQTDICPQCNQQDCLDTPLEYEKLSEDMKIALGVMLK